MNSPRGELTEISEGCIEWKILNFRSLEFHDFHQSPKFSFAKTKWKLCIRRENWGRFKTEVTFLRLERCEDNAYSPINVEYRLNLKDQDGHKEITIRKAFKESEQSPWIPICLDKVETLNLPYSRLTVVFVCQLKCFDPTQDVGNKTLQDLKQLLLSKEDCDVVIRVGDREFRAHSLILKARSPVFASIFRNDMKEKSTGIVDIKDLDPSVFSDFLQFLYGGEMYNLSVENMFDFFAVADKYDVSDLKAKCVEFMKRTLSVDTFCDVMRLALLHSETQLIDSSTDFFMSNGSKIVKTDKWQSFQAENPTKSRELLTEFVKSAEGISVKRMKR